MNGKTIRITRVHLEEDPGKIKRVGKPGEEVSLLDYNRSGIPLVEIVTEPDLKTPSEAREFMSNLLTELRGLVGLKGSDEQTVRVDANISVGKERVEIKNILGLKNLERGLKFEAVRQTRLLKAGKKVVRETRRFDEERKVTLAARKKEFEEDYGYIGEPDLGIFNLKEMVKRLDVRETPLARAERISKEFSIPSETARQIVLTSESLADLTEMMCTRLPPEKVLPWITGPISSRSEELSSDFEELSGSIIEILEDCLSGKITDLEAKRRIDALFGEELDHEISEMPAELGQLVNEIIDANPSIVEDYRQNEKAANFIIGQVMRTVKGRFSSSEVVEAVHIELKKRI